MRHLVPTRFLSIVLSVNLNTSELFSWLENFYTVVPKRETDRQKQFFITDCDISAHNAPKPVDGRKFRPHPILRDLTTFPQIL